MKALFGSKGAEREGLRVKAVESRSCAKPKLRRKPGR
jgi:hypothetical protein